MLRLEHIAKQYRGANGVNVLRDVTVSLAAGEFAVVRGPSGCGKTTLLLIAGGMLTPSAGRVVVAGPDLRVLRTRARAAFRRRHIGFVFQMFHLVPYLSALDNIRLGLRPGQCPADAGAEAARVGLGARLHHRPHELSVGERQRTAVARALVGRPGLLLADEPTGNLDPDNAAAVIARLREYQRDGGAVMLVTHGPMDTAGPTRAFLLEGGVLAETEREALACPTQV